MKDLDKVNNLILDLLEDPPKQRLYSAKHMMVTDPPDEKYYQKLRQEMQEKIIETWKFIEPNGKIPTLHEKLTPEDLWIIQRVLLFNCYHRDVIGPYLGQDVHDVLL